MTEYSNTNIVQGGKAGGDALGMAGGFSGSQGGSAAGVGAGTASGWPAYADGTGLGVGGDACSGAAAAGSLGGDVSDNTAIGSININS